MPRKRASSLREYEVESQYVGLVIGKQGAGVRELEGLPGVIQASTYQIRHYLYPINPL